GSEADPNTLLRPEFLTSNATALRCRNRASKFKACGDSVPQGGRGARSRHFSLWEVMVKRFLGPGASRYGRDNRISLWSAPKVASRGNVGSERQKWLCGF